MRISASGAEKTKQSARKLGSFGKFWTPGMTLHVAYPIFFDEENQRFELLVGAGWGYQLNGKFHNFPLKKIFWPYTGNVVNGIPETPDLAFKFAPIASAIMRAEFEKKREALESNTQLDATSRRAAVNKLEKEYDVDEEDRIRIAPAVGRLRYEIVTECLAVQTIVSTVTGNTEFQLKTMRVVAQSLSGSKISAINAILAEHKDDIPKDAKHIWVQYQFGTQSDKKQAGKVTPTYVKFEDSLEALKLQPKDEIMVKSMLDSIADDSDIIANRNSMFIPGDERELQNAINTYFVLKQDVFNDLSAESTVNESITRVTKACMDLGLPITSPTLLKEKELLEEADHDLASAPTMEDFSKGIKDAQETHALADESDVEDYAEQLGALASLSELN